MVVSAVIPVKDGERFIAGALDSLLAQGEIVEQIIVVNNGSTDRTADIVMEYADPRIQLLHSDIPNLPLSRNIGAEHATAPWLYFLDADDRVFPGALATLLAAAKRTPRAAVVYGDYCRLDEDGNEIGRRRLLPRSRKPTGDILDALLGGNKMIVGSQIVRADAFRDVGCFNRNIPFAEDWEFWCRMAGAYPFEFVPGLVVLGYTMHTASMSHAKPLPMSKFDPVLDAIFANPNVSSRPDARALRRRAEAGALTYISTEAVRIGAHWNAVGAFGRAIATYPAKAPLITAKYVGAYVGL